MDPAQATDLFVLRVILFGIVILIVFGYLIYRAGFNRGVDFTIKKLNGEE